MMQISSICTGVFFVILYFQKVLEYFFSPKFVTTKTILKYQE